MAVTEAARHDLHEGLIDTLGPERAATLMEHLPPVGWADVATKEHVDQRFDHLNEKFDQRLDHLNEKLDHLNEKLDRKIDAHAAHLRGEMEVGFAKAREELHTELRDHTRFWILGLVGTNLAFGSLLVGAVALLMSLA
jgi:hypothetical protein